jgi:3'-5' exoribonuclease
MHEAPIETAATAPPLRPAARIAELAPGMHADGVFVVKKLVRRSQPNGSPFTLFQFADRSGHINGVLWQEPGAGVEVGTGDLAHVQGEVQLYQNARQIRVRAIRRADPTGLDARDFLPRSPCDGEALWSDVRRRIAAVGNPYLHRLYSDLFDDADFAARYRAAPAGKGWHHASVGGLLEHVCCMLELGDVVARQHPGLDRDLLLGGILLHDVGKIDELVLRGHIEYTDAGRLVGHLVQGCLRVGRAMDAIADFPDELRMRLLHVLVSHHGAVERGSPKAPMTLEAVVVHLLDHMDSQVHGIEQVLSRGGGPDGWTETVKLLERALYVGPPAAPPPAS